MSDEKQVTVVYGAGSPVVVDGDVAAAKRWVRAQRLSPVAYESAPLVPAPPDTVTFEVTLSVEDAKRMTRKPGRCEAEHILARAARAALDAREDRGE